MKTQSKSSFKSSTRSSQTNDHKNTRDPLLRRYSQEQNISLKDLEETSPIYRNLNQKEEPLRKGSNKRPMGMSERKVIVKSGDQAQAQSKGSSSGSKGYTKINKGLKDKENVHPENRIKGNKSMKKALQSSPENFSPRNVFSQSYKKSQKSGAKKVLETIVSNQENLEDRFSTSQSLYRANVMNFIKKNAPDSCNTSQTNDATTKDNTHFDKKSDESYFRESIINQSDETVRCSAVMNLERIKNLRSNTQIEYRNTSEQQLFSAPVSVGREISCLDQSGLLNSELFDSYYTERSTTQSGKSVKNTDLIKMIQALKCQVQAKDLKISEFRRKIGSSRNKGIELKLKLNEVTELYKTVDNEIEKVQNQVEHQKDEIKSLSTCNQRLEENIRNNSRANVELKDFAMKVIMYERLAEEKYKEAFELTRKLQKAEANPLVVRKFDPEFKEEIDMLKEEIQSQEKDINKLIKKIEKAQTETEEYKKAENRLGDLEDLQNYLMEENDRLKEQVSEEEEKEQQLRAEIDESNHQIQDKLLIMYDKLRELDENVKRLILVVEAIIDNKECQIDFDSSYNTDLLEESLQSFKNTQVSKRILGITEELHKKFSKCLEQVSENNTMQYQNECNQQ